MGSNARFILLACLVGVGAAAWGSESKPGEAKRTDHYAVPQDGIAGLAKFIASLAEFRPSTPDEDAEHRARLRPALQQAAEAILRLEKDPKSEVHEAARFILLSNRVRWLAQALPDEQRKTIGDVRAYLVEKLKEGQAQEAAELSNATALALQHAGHWDAATEAYRTFAGMLEKSGDGRLSDLARTMAAGAQRLSALSKESPAARLQISPKGRMVPLDLKGKFNWRSVDVSGGEFHGNGIAELPKGEPTLGGVKFRTSDEMLQLGCARLPNAPVKIEGIPVKRKCARLCFLHAVQYGHPSNVPDGTPIGEYKVHYEDGSEASKPLVFGQDVRDWWIFDQGKPVTRGRVVWTGANPASDRVRHSIRLYMGVWENPHPDKPVARLDFIGIKDGPCAPFCMAITAEEPTQ